MNGTGPAGMDRDKDQLSINTFTSSAVTSDYMHPVQLYTLQHPHKEKSHWMLSSYSFGRKPAPQRIFESC